MESPFYPLNNPLRSRRTLLLVVEDNDDHWSIMNQALGESWPDAKAVRTATVAEARAYLTACEPNGKSLPNLVLLDLYVPLREDGWAVLDFMKATPAYKLVPVVVISESSRADDIREGYDLRVNAYMVKPESYPEWLTCFETFRRYWSDAVTLPGNSQDYRRH